MRHVSKISLFFMFLINHLSLFAHCQMPCGIYDDQMVYDEVDQYYSTMYKCIAALEHNPFKTNEDKNQYVRWIMTKERMSNETAHTLTTYFLQQKIKPGDEDTAALIGSIHKCLFLLVAIKQNVDLNIVKEFGKEWEHFKELFHPEVKCKKEAVSDHEHEHDHEAPHSH